MMALKGIDCAAKISAAAAQEIKAAGYDFVCRYLVPNAGSMAWKALTAQEAQGISDAGLKILCVYESTSSRCKGGAAAGTADGHTAFQLARAYGIPETAILYFAVDFDAQAGDLAAIEAYLRAARAQTGGYEVGVYGSFRVVETMAQRGACKGFWQCYAWSYKQVSDHRTAYQYRNGQTVAGISVDLNEAYDGAGLWSYNKNKESEDEDMTQEQFNAMYDNMMAQRAEQPTNEEGQAAMQKAKEVGLMDGKRASSYLTRADCAIIIARSGLAKK